MSTSVSSFLSRLSKVQTDKGTQWLTFTSERVKGAVMAPVTDVARRLRLKTALRETLAVEDGWAGEAGSDLRRSLYSILSNDDRLSRLADRLDDLASGHHGRRPAY